MAGVFATPRPMPDQKLPFVAGAAVIALALPVFLAAGWDLRGWVIGATLWLASRALAALLTHLRSGMGNLAGSGVVGFGMTFRALAVMVVVIALAATDARLWSRAAERGAEIPRALRDLPGERRDAGLLGGAASDHCSRNGRWPRPGRCGLARRRVLRHS